ncbi:MAG: class I SAM-dependent methyltransferase [Nanoarchaeota archaeon]|nr:class I SAM-dependent methyltransferase [Nanoarchaeota archaeon]
MTDEELEEYVNDIIKKHDYYDRIKDRQEVLRFGKAKNSKLLDIGTGYLSILAAKEFNCRVTSIDLLKEKLKEVQQEARKEGVSKEIRFVEANAAKLPFSDSSFDISVSYGALHHNKNNYRSIIGEMFRVSKKRIVITELTKCGVHLFDRYLYPKEDHKGMALDLEEIKKVLQNYTNKIDVFERKCMATFVCHKQQRRKRKK